MNTEIINNETVLTVIPEGHLDSTTADDFNALIENNLEGVTQLIMDFSKVDYVSSKGIRIILMYNQKMKSCGRMVMKNLNPAVYEVFRLSGLLDVLEIIKDDK